MRWRLRKLSIILLKLLFVVSIPFVCFLACGFLVFSLYYGDPDYSGLEDAVATQCPEATIEQGHSGYDNDPIISYHHESGLACYQYYPDTQWECQCQSIWGD